MGSILTCGDHQSLGLLPEMHFSLAKSFLENFKPPSPYVDIHQLFPGLSDIKFLRSLQDNRFILLEACFDGPAQQTKSLLNEYVEKRTNYNHPNLFAIHRIFLEEYTKWVFPHLRFYLYFDYPVQSLAEHSKIIQHKGFNQREIWTVLDCVVSALAFLQGKAGYSGNIGLSQIFQVLTPKGLMLYKVIDRFFKAEPQPVYTKFFQNLADLNKLKQFSNSIFLSPIQVESLGKGEKYPDHNVFKSDVYSLGVTCLYCIDMIEVSEIYDFNRFEVDMHIIHQRLSNLRSRQYKHSIIRFRISLDLINLLKWMLEHDESKRPDFIDLNTQVYSLSKVLGWDRFETTCHETDYLLQLGKFEVVTSPEVMLLRDPESVEPMTGRDTDVKQQPKYEDVFDRSRDRHIPDDPLIKDVNDNIVKSRMMATSNIKVDRPQTSLGGTITYSNGCYYIGQIVNGMRQGQGIFYDSSGRVLVEGNFVSDAMHGAVKIYNYPEVEATGAFGHFDLSHGKHPWVEYDGYANMGLREGLGTLIYHNGDRFIGNFAQDRANGEGRYEYFEDHHVVEGRWEHDKLLQYFKK